MVQQRFNLPPNDPIRCLTSQLTHHFPFLVVTIREAIWSGSNFIELVKHVNATLNTEDSDANVTLNTVAKLTLLGHQDIQIYPWVWRSN